MSLLVVGSVAFDAVETPFGKREKMLGGAATHFSLAASFFTRVRVVGVVGSDFTDDEMNVFHQRGIDTSDLERVGTGKTFFWRGRYDFDMNTAHTLDTQLNVFADFKPKLSAEAKRTPYLFLANILPDLQREVNKSMTNKRLAALDTMNYWLDSARESLLETIKGVNVLIINDAEARQLAGEPNLHKAAKKIRTLGPKTLIIKRGEYGAALFNESGYFSIPAYPLETVFDPTGAGDSFAGGFMGYIASHNTTDNATDDATLRRAMIYGAVMASFNVEEFGTERVARLTHAEINIRFQEFKQMTHFEAISFEPKSAMKIA